MVSHDEAGWNNVILVVFLLVQMLYQRLDSNGTAVDKRGELPAVLGPVESFTYYLHSCEVEAAGGRGIWGIGLGYHSEEKEKRGQTSRGKFQFMWVGWDHCAHSCPQWHQELEVLCCRRFVAVFLCWNACARIPGFKPWKIQENVPFGGVAVEELLGHISL